MCYAVPALNACTLVKVVVVSLVDVNIVHLFMCVLYMCHSNFECSMFIQVRGVTKERAFEIGKEIVDTVTQANPKPVKLKFEKVCLC